MYQAKERRCVGSFATSAMTGERERNVTRPMAIRTQDAGTKARSGLAGRCQLAMLAIVTALALFAPSAKADDLVIGLSSEATSMDPHFHALATNSQINWHIYDRLTQRGPSHELVPGLAVNWGPTDDPTVWEFELREGVTFHDGTPFTADDVAFTLERAGNVPNSPAGYGMITRDIERVEVIDDHLLRIHTHHPVPLLAISLANIAIVSRAHGEGATTADYNSGVAAVGTGPYRQVQFTPGERIVLEAYPDYWGGPPDWSEVTFVPITSSASRIAALLAGTVDVINDVPTMDIERLSQGSDVALWQGVSDRLIYLHLDSGRAVTPMITANDGSEIENPLRDQRVREALSIAIDREAIAEHVMEGLAIPAGQLIPDGMLGAPDSIGVPRYDPERAMELLAEAGYPDGFAIKLHGPGDRYINDGAVLQAIAQMFSRIGLKTTVDVMPASVYFGRATAGEFSVMLVGWSAYSGEASLPIRTLVATADADRGWGAANRGRYSNPDIDDLLAQAEHELDETERAILLEQAMEMAMADVAVIPVQFQVNIWGTRPGLSYIPRMDEYTLATGVVAAD